MTLRSPLGRARGLGSAKDGAQHFIWQRMTGLALVPIGLWFVISVISLAGVDYSGFRAWLARPCNTAMMLLMILVVFRHAQLGLQVVIEDYIHGEKTKLVWLIGMNFAVVSLGVFSVAAAFRVAFVGG